MLDIPGARDVGQVTRVAVLSGSPAPDSRTWSLAAMVAERLAAQGLEVELIDLRALPAADMLLCATDAGPVRAALDAVAWAHGVVVVTPVHHAAYSGLLKVFLDLLPRSALAGKVVLPMAVGGSPAHVLTIDYALRPVLVSLGAVHVTRGQFLLHLEIERGPDGATCLQWEAERRMEGVLREFTLSMRLHAPGEGVADPRPVVVPRPAPSLAERPAVSFNGTAPVVCHDETLVGAVAAGVQGG
ncbi:MAG TPA: NADPH-dependent FMN reductase [Longimicrobium sp.]|nr:NADPH-dependent FMN reductase [Longimicrobium sp.]